MLNIVTIKDVKLRIGEWCKLKRQEYELSQDDLARELEMSRVTIQQLEAGSNVTLDTLLKVANHFDSLTDIYQFFGSSKNDNNPDSLY
jgi:transcriptional regulator with XRE-family HTH domain